VRGAAMKLKAFINSQLKVVNNSQCGIMFMWSRQATLIKTKRNTI